MDLDPNVWRALQAAVCSTNLLSLSAADQFNWKLVIFDDNNIDFCELEIALQKIGLAKYFFVPVSDLKGEQTDARMFEISVGTRGWAAFFEVDEDGLMPSLEDCIFFSPNFNFMVLRTGFVEHTIYAGSDRFLLSATGIEMAQKSTVVVGSYWPKPETLNYYKPATMSP